MLRLTMTHLRMLNHLHNAPLELLTVISRPLVTHPSRHAAPFLRRALSTSNLPLLAQPSFWRRLLPKALRKQTRNSQASQTTREQNPATPIIILGLLTGSGAIHILRLREETGTFSRLADAKIALLREVIRRVQSGEKFDVDKVLGTGNPQSEREWAAVLQEIENYNRSDQSEIESKFSKRKKELTAQRAAERAASPKRKPSQARATSEDEDAKWKTKPEADEGLRDITSKYTT